MRRFLRLDHRITQLIGGHGEFKAKLFDFGLNDDPWCPCDSGRQTAEHIIWTCPKLDTARAVMLDAVGACVGSLPVWYADLVGCVDCFRAFREFADHWVSIWEDLRQRGSPPLGEGLPS